MDITDKIIENFDEKNIYAKLAEELFELGEVVMKLMTKPEKDLPPIEKLIEEAGDVIVRLKIVCRMKGISDEVNDRVNAKLGQIDRYIDRINSKNQNINSQMSKELEYGT